MTGFPVDACQSDRSTGEAQIHNLPVDWERHSFPATLCERQHRPCDSCKARRAKHKAMWCTSFVVIQGTDILSLLLLQDRYRLAFPHSKTVYCSWTRSRYALRIGNPFCIAVQAQTQMASMPLSRAEAKSQHRCKRLGDSSLQSD